MSCDMLPQAEYLLAACISSHHEQIDISKKDAGFSFFDIYVDVRVTRLKSLNMDCISQV